MLDTENRQFLDKNPLLKRNGKKIGYNENLNWYILNLGENVKNRRGKEFSTYMVELVPIFYLKMFREIIMAENSGKFYPFLIKDFVLKLILCLTNGTALLK